MIFEAKLSVVAQTIDVRANIYKFATVSVRSTGGNWFEMSSIYLNIVNMIAYLQTKVIPSVTNDEQQTLLYDCLYNTSQFSDTGVSVVKPDGNNFVKINQDAEFKITHGLHGGRSTKPTHLIYKLNNKQYKIRQDGRKRFFLVKKEPIYLKDIPGKYSFIKTTS